MKILVYLSFLNPFFTFAQTIESSKAVEKNYLEMETEVFYSEEQSVEMITKSWNLFNLLVRYGIGKQSELNMSLFNVKENEYFVNNVISNHHQFNHFKIGVIQNVWEENGKRPELAIQFNVLFPLGDMHEEANNLGFITSLNFSNSLAKKWLLNYNVGYIKDIDTVDKYFYIGNLQYTLNQNLTFFTENTGEYHGDFDWNQSIGFGYAYKDWTLEMNVGKGFLSPDFFVGGKIICSLNIKKKTIN